MKNIRNLIYAIMLFPCITHAQGINFRQNLSWAQVLQQAQKEHKYIFVDCYASWCGPCKQMDANVYPVDSVGNFVNAHFIPVKYQLDTSKLDQKSIKTRYADAHSIKKNYQIIAYPTFLFFSPEGKLVHLGVGFLDSRGFNALARKSLDPKKQYYTLLAAFHEGKLAIADMPELAYDAVDLNEKKIAGPVAKVYIDHLMTLDEDEVYTRYNLAIIGSFTISSKDRGFNIFANHGDRVDSILRNKGFSQNLVFGIIEREDINPYLYKDGKLSAETPNWAKLQNAVGNKYSADYAERAVLWAKIKWLEQKKDWPDYCKYVILKVEKYGPYCKYFPYAPMAYNTRLNFSAWELFAHSKDTLELEKALAWSKKTIDSSPKPDGPFLDTYANILYKLGRKDEALPLEEKAVALQPDAKDVKESFDKMRKGLPTWQ